VRQRREPPPTQVTAEGLATRIRILGVVKRHRSRKKKKKQRKKEKKKKKKKKSYTVPEFVG